VAGLLIFAIASDYADGYLSRKLKAQTHFGKVLDLVADKSLTGVSLLYAAAQGIDIIPLAVIATRDMLMLGLRLVISEGQQLLPTNRMFGGLMAVLVWGNTLFLVLIPSDSPMVNIATLLYWAAATFFGFNLAMRIRSSWERIKATSTDQELPSLPK
jgi:phosphatidylglycerophosphate synthase